MEARDIAVIVLLVGLAGFAVAYFVVGPGRPTGPRRLGDIPLAARPYHSDEELETTGLERTMAWGFALMLFMALFLPVYWLLEPNRINEKQELFYEQDVARGRVEFAQACATCHGSDAGGGFAPHPDSNVKAPWPVPALNNIVARNQDNPNVTDIEEFITQTVKQGRPGTPMPAWSAFYAGSMTDQQIESIVAYILSIQTGEVPAPQAFVGASGQEIFAANCARCHGQAGEGRVGPELIHVFARYGADGAPVVDGAAAEAVRSTILNGRVVPAYTPMPAWKGTLTPDAIDRLMAYLRSIQQPTRSAAGP
ncbi:MAG: c-type cytochrome [Nitriliruptorales bacterium]